MYDETCECSASTPAVISCAPLGRQLNIHRPCSRDSATSLSTPPPIPCVTQPLSTSPYGLKRPFCVASGPPENGTPRRPLFARRPRTSASLVGRPRTFAPRNCSFVHEMPSDGSRVATAEPG